MLAIFRLRRSRGFLLFVSNSCVHAQMRTRFLRGAMRAIVAVLAMWGTVTGGLAFAQDQAAMLAEHSSIIVLGKVLKTNASDEPMVPPSTQTAIISVQRMYAGSEIAGDQTGRTVTVILSRAAGLKEGEEAVFYANPRFLGKSLTVADESEVPSQSSGASAQAALEQGAQARRDKPILNRLAAASLVFRGSVETVQQLAVVTESKEGVRASAPPSEHDPDWHVATVRITTALRGGEAGQVVTVVFPASQDITWFNVPKLKPGQDALFLVHMRNKQEEPLYRASGLAKFLEKRPTYLVTEPFDVLPAADEARVRGLVAAAKEKKQ